MERNMSKKKFAFASVALVAAVAMIGAGVHMNAPSDLTVHASVDETEDDVKVFVGDVNRAPEGYAELRADYIEALADTPTDETMTAVVGLNDYYAVDTVTAWAENYGITVDRVYMWTKGETGRLSISVDNGDIQAGVERFKNKVEKNGLPEDEQAAEDYQRFLDGEFEVFAVTVTASVEALETLNTEADCINYVDVMQNDEVETYAANAHKEVSYIELPSKPDGAL